MPKPVKTAVAVRNEKTPGRHSVGETLYLMVWPNGGKSWVQRLSIEGKRTDLGLSHIIQGLGLKFPSSSYKVAPDHVILRSGEVPSKLVSSTIVAWDEAWERKMPKPVKTAVAVRNAEDPR